jgi:hypothetical protein
VPLFCEALGSTLDDLAEVHRFPAGHGDTIGLLRSIRPDAIVVDDPSEAERARPWARRHRVPLLLVGLRDERIRILRDGTWEDRPGATVEAIRNALAGFLFGQRNSAA